MTVTLQNGQLKVTLSETETVKYNIDRVFFDKSGKEAQMALLLLLKTAAGKTAFKPRTTRFLIELYPVFDGGCEVYFIPDREAQTTDAPTDTDLAVFDINTSEALLSAIELLYNDPDSRDLVSTVYEYRSRYRLTVKHLPERLYKTVLYNFADRVPLSESETLKPTEIRRTLCADNAIQRIGSALADR